MLLRDVRNTLKRLPTELDESYNEVMQRISHQETQQREAAMRILSWISYALRPLSFCELQHAISIEPEDDDVDEEAMLEREDVLSVCAGLLIMDQQSQTVRLIHYTAHDYFERFRDRLFPGFHANITLSCVTYLSLKALYKSRQWVYFWYREGEHLFEEYPFVRYAAQYLGDHARRTPETALDQQTLQKIRDLLLNSHTSTVLFLVWSSMELYRKPDDQHRGSFYNRDCEYDYLNQDVNARNTEEEQELDSVSSDVELEESISSDQGLDQFVSHVRAMTKLLELKSAGDQELYPAQAHVHEGQEVYDQLDAPEHQQSEHDKETLTLLLCRLKKQLKMYMEVNVSREEANTLASSNTEEGAEFNCLNSYHHMKGLLGGHRNEDQQKDQNSELHFRSTEDEGYFLSDLCSLMEELGMFEEEDMTEHDAHRTIYRHAGARNLNREGSDAWGEHSIELSDSKADDDEGNDSEDEGDSHALDDSDNDDEDDDASMSSGGHSRIIGWRRNDRLGKTLRYGSMLTRSNATETVTPLHLAAFLGLKEVVSMLLEDNPNIDAKDCDGNTAVDIAVTNGFEDLTTFFVQKGASVHLNTQYGQAILLVAVQNNYNGIVDIILDRAVPTAAGGELAPFQHQIQLLSAAFKGDSRTILGLVDSGLVKLTSRDMRFAQTAMCFAVERNHLETVEILVQHGLDVHIKDHMGQPLLHRATWRGYEAMVQLLLRHGAKVDFQDPEGRTAWAAGILMGDRLRPNILTILEKAGADSNTKGVDGVNPLYQAAATGQTEIVRPLLESGTDPSITTDFGWAPLHWAAHNGQVDCVRLLLDHHADLSPMSDQSTTPLDMARKNNQVEISEILEQAGAKSAQQVLSDSHSSYRRTQGESPDTEEYWGEEHSSDEDAQSKHYQHSSNVIPDSSAHRLTITTDRAVLRRLLRMRPRPPLRQYNNDGDQRARTAEMHQTKQTEQVKMDNILENADSKSAGELLREVEGAMSGDIELGQQHVAS